MTPMDVTINLGSSSELTPLLTWLGLAGFVVFCIIRGWLVPRSTHQDLIHDRDIWREAARLSEEARRDEHEQSRELFEIARTTKALVEALPKPQRSSGD